MDPLKAIPKNLEPKGSMKSKNKDFNQRIMFQIKKWS